MYKTQLPCFQLFYRFRNTKPPSKNTKALFFAQPPTKTHLPLSKCVFRLGGYVRRLCSAFGKCLLEHVLRELLEGGAGGQTDALGDELPAAVERAFLHAQD